MSNKHKKHDKQKPETWQTSMKTRMSFEERKKEGKGGEKEEEKKRRGEESDEREEEKREIYIQSSEDQTSAQSEEGTAQDHPRRSKITKITKFRCSFLLSV